jgi:hypothetical protein
MDKGQSSKEKGKSDHEWIYNTQPRDASRGD